MNKEFSPDKIANTRLFIVFEEHNAQPDQVTELRGRYERLMRDAFVLSQRNIYVIERPEQMPSTPKIVVFPKNVVEFEINLAAAEAREGELRKGTNPHTLEEWRSLVRRVTFAGGNPNHLHTVTTLQAVDILNQDGYRIGLMYEDGVKPSDDFRRFVSGNLPLDPPGFKDKVRELHDFDDIRDEKLVTQVLDYRESVDAQPTNIFIGRGPSHPGTLDFLPPPYLDRVIFAFSFLHSSQPRGQLRLDRTLKSGQEPAEEVWQEAYLEYSRVIASR